MSAPSAQSRRMRQPRISSVQVHIPAASYLYAIYPPNTVPTQAMYSGETSMNLPTYTALPQQQNATYFDTLDDIGFDWLWNEDNVTTAWPELPNNPPPPYTSRAIPDGLPNMHSYLPVSAIRGYANSADAVAVREHLAPPDESGSALQFVDYGSHDPQKGKRRKDENEDHRRKENIARKGGACHACKSSRKQCDGEQPCGRCRKKGLLSEAAMQTQLLSDPDVDEQHPPCFTTDTQRLFDWRKHFDLIPSGVQRNQTVFLDISCGAKRTSAFQVPLTNLAQCFQSETRDLVGVDLTVEEFAAAFSTKPKATKSKVLDQPKASLAAQRVLEIFLAIRNFLHSDVAASVSDPQMPRTLCAFLLVGMLDLLIERVCVIERELSVLSHIQEFCYRKWDENLESIELLQKIMQSLERLPAKKELDKLLSPLQNKAGSFRAHLFHLAKIARPPSKAIDSQQKSGKKQPKNHEPEPFEDDGLPRLCLATIAISQHGNTNTIPTKGRSDIVEDGAPRMPVAYFLESRGSFSDYQQDVFDGKEAPLSPPSRETSWFTNETEEAYLGLGGGSHPDYGQHPGFLASLPDGGELLDFDNKDWAETLTARNTVADDISDMRAFEDASTVIDPENVLDLDFHLPHGTFDIPEDYRDDQPAQSYSESVTPKPRPEPLSIHSRKSSLSLPSPTSPSKSVQFADRIETVAEIEVLSYADLPLFRPEDPEKFSIVMGAKRRTRSATSSSRSRERAPRKKMNYPLRLHNSFSPLFSGTEGS